MPQRRPQHGRALRQTLRIACYEGRVAGLDEINAAVTEAVKGIVEGQLALQTGLQQLNARLNEILQRTNP